MLKMNFVVVLVALIGILPVFGQMDYCTPTLCRKNVAHVACRNDSNFGPACDESATQLDLLETGLQKLILDAHNTRRSQVAVGNLTGFPSASKMQEMTWDDELAHVAGFNVRKCRMRHDRCRATKRFPRAGQNLAKHSQTNRYLDVGTSLLNMINQWFGEHVNCPPKLVYKFGPAPGTFGHFTAMIQQKSGKIGCAVTQYKNGKWFMMLMACNYQYTNMKGEEIYAVGKSCSQCSGKCSAKYPGLCV